MHVELFDEYEQRVARHRVARLMRNEGLQGVHRRKGRRRVGHPHDLHDDHVAGSFAQDAPNRVWVADATQHRTDEGWLYLSVVLDVFQRKAVGWAMDDVLNTDLVLNALQMAQQVRRPEAGSDRRRHVRRPLRGGRSAHHAARSRDRRLSQRAALEPLDAALIDAEIKLWGERGEPIDQASSYTALRSVATQGDRFILNGRPFRLRMVLDQGYWPETGLTAPDAVRHDPGSEAREGGSGAVTAPSGTRPVAWPVV